VNARRTARHDGTGGSVSPVHASGQSGSKGAQQARQRTASDNNIHLMRKRSTLISEPLPPLKLYLDDLATVYGILQAACTEAVLRTEDYETNDPAELSQLPNHRLRVIEIRSSQPSIWVTLGRFSGNQVLAFQDDLTSQGLVRSVRSELARHERRLVRWLTFPRSFVYTAVIVGIAAYSFIDNSHWDPLKKIVITTAAVTVWLASLLAVYYQLRGANLIILAKRRDAPGFWQRNRDALIVGGVLAIVGAIAGSVVTYLFTRP
jgi:hypothetical protein